MADASAFVEYLLGSERGAEVASIIEEPDADVRTPSHLELLDCILALRDNFSAYDATYVALAESLQAELLTCDEPLARAVHRHLPRLAVLSVTEVGVG